MSYIEADKLLEFIDTNEQLTVSLRADSSIRTVSQQALEIIKFTSTKTSKSKKARSLRLETK